MSQWRFALSPEAVLFTESCVKLVDFHFLLVPSISLQECIVARMRITIYTTQRIHII